MAGVFEEPVRLGMDASLTKERELPVWPVYGPPAGEPPGSR
jgi:hypothetical protein